ncbi:nucleotide pyrophosphohydrolase [Ideonella sp. 4Y11]|uniref:Nucleotide pyrophosphohydrolase n=1 Tax=Ideonella aquatica TaxID=2824119 RepID=A0A940YHE1_9BURK|nr:nucleotide pyrophosphohydrolase [Ideonella aquatica]MBQ0958161.1 nucleotide pyrophosphohydrolase [Ideonella aquatica]
MNLGELQAELRHFAAERDWQPFHTPKNLSTALMVEAAELAEIFQWQTPEESRLVPQRADVRQHVGEELADVLLYLLQLADHCQVDLPLAVRDKLAKNAQKYPARQQIPRPQPPQAAVSGVHVLLDFENVQPTNAELRALVPQAGQVWVFHGPHQRQVAKRFASFGEHVTAVPISKTGKNALDFHLSFYMGYIASRNPEASMVVVANDKGYEPMLEHAQAMGFVVRRQPFPATSAPAKKTTAKASTAKPATAKKTPASRPAAAAPKKAAPATRAPTKQAPTKQAAPKKVPAKKVSAKKAPAKKVPAKAPAAGPSAAPATAVSAKDLQRITEQLSKAGDKRPTKLGRLRGLLKSLLSAQTGDAVIEWALHQLEAAGTVVVGSNNDVRYPRFLAASAPAGR